MVKDNRKFGQLFAIVARSDAIIVSLELFVLSDEDRSWSGLGVLG